MGFTWPMGEFKEIPEEPRRPVRTGVGDPGDQVAAYERLRVEVDLSRIKELGFDAAPARVYFDRARQAVILVLENGEVWIAQNSPNFIKRG